METISPDDVSRIFEKLDKIEANQAEIKEEFAAYRERTKHQEVRIDALEKKAWGAVVAIVVALTSVLATGAKSFVDFFTGR